MELKNPYIWNQHFNSSTNNWVGIIYDNHSLNHPFEIVRFVKENDTEIPLSIEQWKKKEIEFVFQQIKEITSDGSSLSIDHPLFEKIKKLYSLDPKKPFLY